jgi:hypothetical protein
MNKKQNPGVASAGVQRNRKRPHSKYSSRISNNQRPSPWKSSPKQTDWPNEFLQKVNGDLDRLSATVEDDRLFFKANPKRRFHIREATPHEILVGSASQWVLVCNALPGVRVRIPVPQITGGPAADCDSDRLCQLIFDSLMGGAS